MLLKLSALALSVSVITGKQLYRSVRDFDSQYDRNDMTDADYYTYDLSVMNETPQVKQVDSFEDVVVISEIPTKEEELVFPVETVERTTDTRDSIIPRASFESKYEEIPDDFDIIENQREEYQRENQLISFDEEPSTEIESQSAKNDLYTTAERTHRLLTELINASLDFFEHNEYMRNIILVVKSINEEMGLEVEKLVDHLENLGQLLEQIENFDQDREINWNIGNDFSVDFIFDKDFLIDERQPELGVRQVLISAGIRYAGKTIEANQVISNFTIPRSMIENNHHSQNQNYHNFLSFKLERPALGSSGSFIFTNEATITCDLLSKIEILDKYVGCISVDRASNLVLNSIPLASYGFQNSAEVTLYNEQNQVTNNDWLKISYDTNYFADNVYIQQLSKWDNTKFNTSLIKDQFLSTEFFSNGAIDVNYPESKRLPKRPDLIIAADEMPITVSGKVGANFNSYVVYKNVHNNQTSHSFEMLDNFEHQLAIPETFESSFKLQVSAYSIRQNIEGPNDYSCFTKSFMDPQGYSDTCYLGFKIRPQADNENMEILEFRIRKGLPSYTDHFDAGRQEVLNLAEVAFHYGQKVKANFIFEHDVKNGFYEYSVGILNRPKKTKSSLMILRYADFETVREWLDNIIDAVIPYFWAIEVFINEPGTLLYADRVILKLLPTGNLNFRHISNAAQLGVAFPRCLIDPATEGLDIIEYFGFLISHPSLCSSWVPADEFSEKMGNKLEKSLIEAIKIWKQELMVVAYWVKTGRSQLVGIIDTVQLVYTQVNSQIDQLNTLSGPRNSVIEQGQYKGIVDAPIVHPLTALEKAEYNLNRLTELTQDLVFFIFESLNEQSRKQYLNVIRKEHTKCKKQLAWCRDYYFQQLEFGKTYLHVGIDTIMSQLE